MNHKFDDRFSEFSEFEFEFTFVSRIIAHNHNLILYFTESQTEIAKQSEQSKRRKPILQKYRTIIK